MALPRVVVLDDDPSILRLVALALDALPIELVCCTRVAEARRALAAGPVQLLVTDLMLPGESGWDLLRQLRDEPALRAGARLAVFSAGLNAQARTDLSALGVWRQLSKPVSMLELAACVEEALAPGDDGPLPGPASDAATSPEAWPADEAAAVQAHFAGDEALFQAFRAGCVLQFEADIDAGDAAVVARDAPALRRLAHSLKSVLRSLGHAGAGTQAADLERAAGPGGVPDWPALAAGWQGLRAYLRKMIELPPPGRT